jgi:hypothetical protein
MAPEMILTLLINKLKEGEKLNEKDLDNILYVLSL